MMMKQIIHVDSMCFILFSPVLYMYILRSGSHSFLQLNDTSENLVA